MATTVQRPLRLDLTRVELGESGDLPLTVGADWSLRFQVREDVVLDDEPTTQPVTLADASATFVIYDGPSGVVLLSRTSGVTVTDSDPEVEQIDFDADQDDEDTEEDSGAGWMTVHVTTTTTDQQAVASAVGTRRYYLDVTFPDGGDGSTLRCFAGRIEVVA